MLTLFLLGLMWLAFVDAKNGYQATPNAAGNRLARQGQSELTGLLGPGSDAN